ncbi:MAG TPA: histidine kinase dimerization/phosphoacceptor domain -containing protein [Azospirillaceae bacterium]|nr:histidine kinase dimerization/phosphoacceptor domain -containing protein [Azospirillaceae bacterium]
MDFSPKDKPAVTALASGVIPMPPHSTDHRMEGRPSRWPAGFMGRVTSKVLLVGILGLFLVVGGGLGILALWTEHRSLLRQAEFNVWNVSRLLEQHAIRTLQSCNLVMQRAANGLSLESLGQGTSLNEEARQRMRIRDFALALPEAGSLRVFDRWGRLVLWSDPSPTPPVDAGTSPFPHAPAANVTGLLISPLTTDGPNGAPFFAISRSITGGDGTTAGFITAAIDAQRFTNFHDHVNLGANAVLAILRTDGMPVLHQPLDHGAVGLDHSQTALFQEHLPRSPSGIYRAHAKADGIERIFAYQTLPGLPLVAVAAIAVDEALLPWWHSTIRLAALGLAALAMLFALSLVTLRSIRREEAGWLAVQQAIDALVENNENLEMKIEERTAQLCQINTRLKSALDQKDVLLKEVNHRVKNSLQMISSLLTLQSGTVAESDARRHLTEACNRVTTVAQIHQRLYESARFETVEFSGFLHGLCADLASSLVTGPEGSAIAVTADDADLPIDEAIPLALIANELVTNALKYAYLPGQDGAVTVEFHALPDGRRVLTVADCGAGLPDDFEPSRRGGLGMQVVTALVGQLDGDLHLDRQPPGVRFTITLPARSAMA